MVAEQRRSSVRRWLTGIADRFDDLPAPAPADAGFNPIQWKGYPESRARAAAASGEAESVILAVAAFGGTACVVIAFEFAFLGGSIGRATGDRIEAAHHYAREHRLPVVSFTSTGGSRLQEGMVALAQLQRIAAQQARTARAGLAQIAVVLDPTTGGGWATLGAGADVVLAEAGAQVAFAGSRVRPADADPAAYTAEAQLAAGHVDAVVETEAIGPTLARWLRLLRAPASRRASDAPGSHSASDAPASKSASAAPAMPPSTPAPPPALRAVAAPATGWQAVQNARDPNRPRARDYLDAYFAESGFELLTGDRAGGTDPGVLCGFGLRDGEPVAFAAQCGTRTRAAGFRTVTRLVRLADRLGIPILTLIDTPGAANDAESEKEGVGGAIARTYLAVAEASVPITSLVIGEGTSGGALALAAPGNLWATPDSYFTVLGPEAAAAVLKRGPERVAETAGDLRIRPEDVLALGILRGIVPPAE